MKIDYQMKTVQRKTATQDGTGNILLNGEHIANFVYSKAGYQTTMLDGRDVGLHYGRGGACKAARKAHLAAQESEQQTESLDEAAARLCSNAQNPLGALKKRISRGAVQTIVVNGETRVVV